RERDVFEARPGTAPHFDRAAVGFVDEAIGHGDVLGLAAAETEHRPAGAEGTVRHRDELATAEQRAGVVLALDCAVREMHVLGADEMKAVIVVRDAAVNADSIQLHEHRLDDANGVEGAVLHENVPDAVVLALMNEDAIGPVRASDASMRWLARSGAVEFTAVAIDPSRPFNGEFLGFYGENQAHIAVAQR